MDKTTHSIITTGQSEHHKNWAPILEPTAMNKCEAKCISYQTSWGTWNVLNYEKELLQILADDIGNQPNIMQMQTWCISA